VLTHFAAPNYATLAERKASEDAARKIFAETLAAVDDLVVDL
jgi:hypothetical protein